MCYKVCLFFNLYIQSQFWKRSVWESNPHISSLYAVLEKSSNVLETQILLKHFLPKRDRFWFTTTEWRGGRYLCISTHIRWEDFDFLDLSCVLWHWCVSLWCDVLFFPQNILLIWYLVFFSPSSCSGATVVTAINFKMKVPGSIPSGVSHIKIVTNQPPNFDIW